MPSGEHKVVVDEDSRAPGGRRVVEKPLVRAQMTLLAEARRGESHSRWIAEVEVIP
jgi:hypothetical protein